MFFKKLKARVTQLETENINLKDSVITLIEDQAAQFIKTAQLKKTVEALEKIVLEHNEEIGFLHDNQSSNIFEIIKLRSTITNLVEILKKSNMHPEERNQQLVKLEATLK